MNIPKAVSVLRDILTNVQPGDPPEEHEAINLGIQALEHIHKCRFSIDERMKAPLPGETK